MDFNELRNEQRRQLVDARQIFEAYQAARAKWAHSFAGSMRWVSRKGNEYLHRKRNKQERSLGRRSSETEAQFKALLKNSPRVHQTPSVPSPTKRASPGLRRPC